MLLPFVMILCFIRFCGTEGTSKGWYSAFKSDFAAIKFKSDDAYPAAGFEGKVTAIKWQNNWKGYDAEKACREKINAQSPATATATATATANQNNEYEYEYYYEYY